MKRLLKTLLKTLLVIAILGLICLGVMPGILDFSALEDNEAQFIHYTGYYFNKLNSQEKAIYVEMDNAIKDNNEKVFIGFDDSKNLYDKVNNVITAYLHDNPKCFYLSNEYMISTRDFGLFEYSQLQLKYTMTESEIAVKSKQLETTIDSIISKVIESEMTDFEKEVAIHNALVSVVNYYEYNNIDNIPNIKHTAYGALVEQEAVCDGYAKAFMLLLERVGIKSIIVSGVADNTAHAWNIVKLAEDFYHVDATSDKVQQDSNKKVTHAYFNLDDATIEKTHTLNTDFEMPKCNSKEYNYYVYNDYYVDEDDNLYNKLNKIMIAQKDNSILEVKVNGKYNATRIVDTLYDLNYANWKSDRKTTVEYTHIGDIYIFEKN